MNMKSQRALASKAFFAAVGAPVLAGRRLLEYRDKLGEYGDTVSGRARKRFDEAAVEGEKMAKQLQERKVFEEIQSRVDFEKLQERVEHFRDQLESALENWREATATEAKPAPKKTPAKAAAKKPAAKKAPAKAAAKKPAAKKAPAKAAAKKPAAKKTAAKPAAKKETAGTAAK
jgi:hypothetical protein